MITAVPLLFEVRPFMPSIEIRLHAVLNIASVVVHLQVKREGLIEDLERVQIGKALAEGRTPQELAMEGLTSAVDPKVLK
jgi:hypothetical protein